MASRDTLSPQDIFEARVRAEREMLLHVLNSYEGRHVLFNVLAHGDIYEQNGPIPEGDQGQRAIGRREMALEVLKEALTVRPDVYIVMQQEAGDFEEKYAVDMGSIEGEERG